MTTLEKTQSSGANDNYRENAVERCQMTAIERVPSSEPSPRRWLRVMWVFALLAPLGAGAQMHWATTFTVEHEGPWTGPRLSDGQPNIEGVWSNDISNHDNFTDPHGGIPGDPSKGLHVANGAGDRPVTARNQRAPSRVSDPTDGQVPFQPWARAEQQELLANFFNPTKQEYVEPGAHCAPAGIPKSLYWHGYEITPFPGIVLFSFNGGTRIVYLDGRPHLPDNIKLWNADSRGHWEGNTLVVDVSNNNGKARFGRTGEFASEHVHIVERYTFAADHYTYNAVFTDPTVYTRPFTVTIPAHRITEQTPQDGWHNEQEWANLPPGRPAMFENYERICVENNHGHGAIVAGGKAP
jgi:hypothetical protein